MIKSVILLATNVVFIFVMPLEYMILTGAYLSLLVILWDAYERKPNFLNIAILVINMAIGFVYYILKIDNVLPYTGSFFYGVISVAGILGYIIGKPFTLIGKKTGAEELGFHRILNLVIGLINLVALVLSIVLIPNPVYIILPILLAIASIVLSGKIAGLLLSVTKTENK